MIIKDIESKWQKIWHEQKAFEVMHDANKLKYYVLEMLPYPSGKIHVGHVRNYSIGDVIARFMMMKGYNVLHPMGWDAFGLPAENAAIKNNSHPKEWTYANIDNMRSQLKAMGFSYDWSKEITSCDPNYYKHEQKFFLELYEKGLAYQKESLVNWDPVDNTVLANEQVVDGRGWRSGALIEKRYLKQWFLKITDYSEELLDEIKNLKDWPEAVRLMQEKWIGKSIGVNFHFKIKDHELESIEVFSTKPETIFGASFVGIAFNHPIIDKLVDKSSELINFIAKCSSTSSESEIDKAKKEGILTGLYAIHPFDANITVPIIITNFVLMDYGTGAVFGCPAHDERDHLLAIQMRLPINQVIYNPAVEINVQKAAYTGEGILINSAFLNDLTSSDAKQKVIEKFEELSIGERSINYRLKDWGVSRQRFWGCPIPMIYCEVCGLVAVPYDQLPVTLPKDVTFNGHGNPLDQHPTWKHTVCPKCANAALRETDTFDTFFESSWYFTRYCDANAPLMTNKEACNYWLPVDQYIGGIEHAVMHLLYARFFTKVMNEQNYISVREPFKSLFTQGMVLHATYQNENGDWLYPNEVIKQGNDFIQKETGKLVIQGRIEKMSKSKKNLIDLETIKEKYGADAIRLFVLSDSPPEKDLEWSASGIEGSARFIAKLEHMAKLIVNLKDEQNNLREKSNTELEKLIHITIKNVEEDIKRFNLNKAIARIRELFNSLSDEYNKKDADYIIIKEGFFVLVQLLNPFIPHITEEIWQLLGNKTYLYNKSFPQFNETLLITKSYILAIQINGKLRDTHEFSVSSSKEEIEQMVINLPKIQKFLENKELKKIIFIPQKVINIIC